MPGKKVTKPNSESSDIKFTWDNFARECINNNYTLVIGSEAVLNKEQNIEANGDSLKLLFNCTVDYLKEKQIVVDGISNFTQLGQTIFHIREKVLSTISELDFYENFDEEIEPTLMQLLSTRCFRTVLTTCIDPYLEIAMEKVWGKGGYRILNIYGDNKDFVRDEMASEEFNEIKPTLYYVFGKADINNEKNKFVLSENDAMQAIRNWFDKDSRPNSLLEYIQNTRIISIGCKFDDWLFRFFWFILRGGNNLSEGEVAVEFADTDKNLQNYLKQQKIKIFPDSRAFMKKAYPILEEALHTYGNQRKMGGIFISYAHEDKYLALKLFNKLVENGFNVWIDEDKIKPSNEYDQRIANAINQCHIFMPLLSTQVMYDLQAGNGERYYQQFEWHTAQLRYNDEKQLGTPTIKILPVVIGRYDERESYHQKVDECIKNASKFQLAGQPFKSLIEIINNIK